MPFRLDLPDALQLVVVFEPPALPLSFVSDRLGITVLAISVLS